jgi:hypothetical protein
MQQDFGGIEQLVGSRGICTIDGLASGIQSRFDLQPEGYNLGVQRQTAGVQISLDRIRGTKISSGPGSQQPQPPLGVLFKLNLRSSGGRNPRIGGLLRTDYSHPQEQTHQAFHGRALTSFSARSISSRMCVRRAGSPPL